MRAGEKEKLRVGECRGDGAKDTLRVGLVDGLVGLVDVLHGDGVGELVEHPLLEGFQPLVVMAAAHELLVLQKKKKATAWECADIWWWQRATAPGGGYVS